MKYQAVVFDFDGTLAQSGKGITRSVQYALEKMGFPALEEAELRRFVGPALLHSFETICGMTEAQALRAIELYRERYLTVGLYEAELYPGIAPLLKKLNEAGCWVAVASGKPTSSLERMAEHFGIRKYLRVICGSDMDSHSADKHAQLRAALPEGLGLDSVVMVGDRSFDVDAGLRLGAHTIGVTYGYGSAEELKGAEMLADSVASLRAYILEETEMPRGRLLTFEGSDGCGKSTQLRLLAEKLAERGYEVVATREPGGCGISERIREVILSLDSAGMSAECEALLYAAARTEHVYRVILPALKEGKIVLCDRFLDSSIAYQGYGRELGEDFVRLINKVAASIEPDCTLMYEIDRAKAKERMAQGAPLDRLEIEREDFFERVADAYDRIADSAPGRIVRIDAGRGVEAVFEDTLRAALQVL